MKKIEDFMPIDTFQVECEIIGDFIHNSTSRNNVIRVVSEKMFFNTECKNLWNKITEMHNHKMPIDVSTTYNLCSQEFYLNNILNCGVYATDISAMEHAKVLADLYIRKTIYQLTINILDMLDKGEQTDNIIEEITNLDKAIKDEFKGDDVMTMASAAQAFLDDLAKGKVNKIRTGIPTIDNITYGGFNGGQLVIIGGRPSDGKSQVAMQFAQFASKERKAVYFTIEMTEKDLAQRALVATGEVSFVDIVQTQKDWSKFERALNKISSDNLILTRNCRTLSALENKIMSLHQEGKCEIAFIDYLQLIRHKVKSGNIRESIVEMTARLKQLALDLDIPIVLLSQLNRGNAAEHRVPELTDLKESGSIEQDADIVLLLNRPTEEGDSTKIIPQRLDIYLRKHRNGKILGDPIRLKGNESYAQFYELYD